jgi:hypothetical protein
MRGNDAFYFAFVRESLPLDFRMRGDDRSQSSTRLTRPAFASFAAT